MTDDKRFQNWLGAQEPETIEHLDRPALRKLWESAYYSGHRDGYRMGKMAARTHDRPKVKLELTERRQQ